ncbi:hypothetical protein M6B22_13415 [Jatrophihabitans cynanchi]|uniref:Transposase n=1 Tax=Jatrophihabitans cynanchi TaxID=2944128 RepID=A0ABY7JSJ3_9ACTN|nr:hypothetical protein [Jatrophihabitans sp. SB3-54]WAX55539.1 hypothetical protein M6B22_13415 [Jatrophihabitans sp. SB3-54]
MRKLRAVRSEVLTTADQVRAVFSLPALYRLAALLPTRQGTGRPAQHPAWVLLGYGVLARVYRSGVRVENELRHPGTWQLILDAADWMRAEDPELEISPAGPVPPGWDAWKYARNHYFTDPEVLDALREEFTRAAVEQARQLGLLRPDGPGSLTHPDRSRTVYGDGTVVRPMYRPPAARRVTDPATGLTKVEYLDPDGNPIASPRRRFDPDAADFHGHAGPVHGQNFVALYARGDRAHQRVVLGVHRTERPGGEAEAAVAGIKALHVVAGAGMQVVVYDGALRGVHIDELMRECGLLVVNKVHASSKTRSRKQRAAGQQKPPAAPRWHPLGQWEHDTPTGVCRHTLAAVDGAVSEIGTDDAGTPVVVSRLPRKQVKRSRRLHGGYHFNVAYEIPCPQGVFLAWVTPHGEPGDPDHRRADAVRVIAEGEEDFTRLYGLRNDAEAFNAHFKRSLLVDRAMSLGAARQLLDVLCYGLLNNALAAHHAATASDRQATLRRLRAPRHEAA